MGCLAALMVGLGVGPSALAAPPPAVAPPAMLRVIETIRTSESMQAVMEAYTLGCTLDRQNGDLHDAYMRRMLKLEKPQVAAGPAQVLTLLKPDNPLAWAVNGWSLASRNEFARALPANIRAAELLPECPAVMFNLGTLVAWYENQKPPPTLPKEAKEALARQKAEWARQGDYAKAYKEMVALYKNRETVRKQAEEKKKQAEAEVKKLQQEIVAIDRDGQRLGAEIAKAREAIRQARFDSYGSGTGNTQKRIAAENRRIAEAQKELAKLARQRQELLDKHKKAQENLKKIIEESQVDETELAKLARWHVPPHDADTLPPPAPPAGRPVRKPAGN